MPDNVNDFISNERKDFGFAELGDLTGIDDPLTLVHAWLKDAIDRNAPEAYAFTLSTVSSSGYPASRVVYARNLSSEGIIFYTNYNSRKGKEITLSAKACGLFFWPLQERQIRFEGMIEKISGKESDEYFAGRPRDNQLGAWASNQSEKIQSRKELEEKMAALDAKYKDMSVPRPPHWGGYRIKPVYFEFWQGRPGRLHDRLVFEKEKSGWKIFRISP
ncbi:MAG: pyridoxamine 5'-phosphate oxidase [Flavobacteriales bacterium]